MTVTRHLTSSLQSKSGSYVKLKFQSILNSSFLSAWLVSTSFCLLLSPLLHSINAFVLASSLMCALTIGGAYRKWEKLAPDVCAKWNLLHEKCFSMQATSVWAFRANELNASCWAKPFFRINSCFVGTTWSTALTMMITTPQALRLRTQLRYITSS